ncbi:MAG: nitrous oxide reductase accessory protein NosL, partial [Candidatus Methylacidiphilales bacterium]
FGNKRNLVLLPKSTTGWCNQNVFVGGRLGYSSGEGVSASGSRHIYIGAPAGTSVGSPNGNTFIGTSIEGDEPEFHLDIEGAYINPDAAIKVPGMTYQPPLIGYKQLLNFGAYSVPDFGGWLFIGAGVFMLAIIIIENNLLAFINNKKTAAYIIPLVLFFSACGNVKPKAVRINYDNCEFCKMTIVDAKFACQIVNSKGKAYFFDDVKCLKNYLVNNQNLQNQKTYVSNYIMPNTFIEINNATVITSSNIASPMGGNMAAFENEKNAQPYIEKLSATITKWN